MIETIVKWPGGKQLVRFADGRYVNEVIKELYSHHLHSRFVDLFCGGLSISLTVNPEYCLANDLNFDVINLYLEIAKDGVWSRPMFNVEGFYYVIRDAFNKAYAGNRKGDRDRALYFYYLNRHCFNGLVRYAQDGGFNSSFGFYKYSNFRPDLSEFTEIIKDWEFSALQWDAVELGEMDFVVADPPYVGTFDKYNPGGFSMAEQEGLALKLSKHPGPVILFNSDTPEMRDLYRSLGFALFYVYRGNKINKTRVGDEAVSEIFATRNL